MRRRKPREARLRERRRHPAAGPVVGPGEQMSEIAFHGAGILVRYLTFVKREPPAAIASPSSKAPSRAASATRSPPSSRRTAPSR